MQEFESSNFLLPKQRCMGILQGTENSELNEGVENIFEAYGSMPDAMKFRQELINGIIDKECLIISKNLATKLK